MLSSFRVRDCMLLSRHSVISVPRANRSNKGAICCRPRAVARCTESANENGRGDDLALSICDKLLTELALKVTFNRCARVAKLVDAQDLRGTKRFPS